MRLLISRPATMSRALRLQPMQSDGCYTKKKELLAKMISQPRSSETPMAGEQEADYPAEDEIREFEFSHLEMHHLRMIEINDALDRITRGIYGYCGQCKEMISESRLQADPAVANCYMCQYKAEEKSKRSRI